MYANPGNPQAGIPPHWHYISFGISDLHGDGRVHEYVLFKQLAQFMCCVNRSLKIVDIVAKLAEPYFAPSGSIAMTGCGLV